MSFVFLLCSERSGSNLITSIMNGHKQVSGPPPSHLFRLFGLNAHVYHPLSAPANWQAFLADLTDARDWMIGEWDSAPQAADFVRHCPQHTIAQAFDFLYAQERRAGEQISFVKENYTYLILPFLLANWPDCKFVFSLRDPRDVAASWVKTRAVPGGVKRAIDVWVEDQTANLAAFRQLQPSNRIILVRYEDLIAHTQTTAQALCAHLFIDYDPAMLNFHQDQRTQRNARRTQAWENLAKPILRDNAQKYKSTLSETEIRYIELRCAPLMRAFKYELHTDMAAINAEQAAIEAQNLEAELSPGEKAAAPSKREQHQRAERQKIISRIIARGEPA